MYIADNYRKGIAGLILYSIMAVFFIWVYTMLPIPFFRTLLLILIGCFIILAIIHGHDAYLVRKKRMPRYETMTQDF